MSKIRRGIHYYSTFFPLDSPTRRLVFFDNPPIYLWCNNGTMRSNIQPSIRREGKGNKPSKYHGIRVQRLHRDKANFDRLKMLCYDHKQNLPGSCKKKKHTHNVWTIYWAWAVQSFNNSRNLIRRAMCLFCPSFLSKAREKPKYCTIEPPSLPTSKDVGNHFQRHFSCFNFKHDKPYYTHQDYIWNEVRYVRKRIKNYVVLLYQLCGFTVEDTQFSDCRIDDVILQWQKLHSSFKLT